MLNINPDIVCAIIQKCHEFHAQEGVSIPHENGADGDDDWAMQVLANHADDTTYRELKFLITDLDPETQMELMALLWLGRGDYVADEWEDALSAAQEYWNGKTAEYVVSKPMVSDYLQEGLWALGYGCGE